MAQRKESHPFQCTRCDFTGDSDEVVQHHLDNHVTADKIPFACKDCHFKTFTRGIAFQHRKENHGGTDRDNVSDVFLGAKINASASTFRTLKMVNRREVFKMTYDNLAGYKSTRVWRYGDTPWRKSYRGGISRLWGNRNSSEFERRRFYEPARSIAVEPSDQAQGSLRGVKRKHEDEKPRSHGEMGKRDRDPKRNWGKERLDETAQKPEEERYEVEKRDEESSRKRSSKAPSDKRKSSSRSTEVKDRGSS